MPLAISLLAVCLPIDLPKPLAGFMAIDAAKPADSGTLLPTLYDMGTWSLKLASRVFDNAIASSIFCSLAVSFSSLSSPANSFCAILSALACNWYRRPMSVMSLMPKSHVRMSVAPSHAPLSRCVIHVLSSLPRAVSVVLAASDNFLCVATALPYSGLDHLLTRSYRFSAPAAAPLKTRNGEFLCTASIAFLTLSSSFISYTASLACCSDSSTCSFIPLFS